MRDTDERVLEPSLYSDRVTEPREELLERELERSEAELECALGMELLLPADAKPFSLGLLVGAPSVAVDVSELLELELEP